VEARFVILAGFAATCQEFRHFFWRAVSNACPLFYSCPFVEEVIGYDQMVASVVLYVSHFNAVEGMSI